MSKDIKIRQDSSNKNLSKVAKIKTALASGGDCYWVPEDEVSLGILTVDHDGVYYPANDENGPFYGYSEVRVNGIGNIEMGELSEITITKNGTYEALKDENGPFYGYSKVTVKVKQKSDDDDGGGGSGGGSGGGDTPGDGGDTPGDGGDTPGDGGDTPGSGGDNPGITGKDEDGDDVYVTTDDDGNIITEKLPSRISISSYPDNLFYYDGQTIDYTGLEVKAYLRSGPVYCVVPDNELIKSATVAVAENIPPFSSFIKTLDGKSVQVASSMKFSQYYLTVDPNGFARSVVSSCGNGCIILKNGNSYIAVSYSNDSIMNWQNSEDGSYIFRESERGLSGTVVTSNVLGNGKITNRKIYYCYPRGNDYADSGAWTVFREPDLEDSEYDTLTAADIALGGIGEEASSQQKITLQWKRPRDGKVLDTYFYIRVMSNDDDDEPDSTTTE